LSEWLLKAMGECADETAIDSSKCLNCFNMLKTFHLMLVSFLLKGVAYEQCDFSYSVTCLQV